MSPSPRTAASFGFKSSRGWCFCAGFVLTLTDLALLLDIPAVESGSLLVLHGCAFVEVLGEMGLVEACGFYHLSLR